MFIKRIRCILTFSVSRYRYGILLSVFKKTWLHTVYDRNHRIAGIFANQVSGIFYNRIFGCHIRYTTGCRHPATIFGICTGTGYKKKTNIPAEIWLARYPLHLTYLAYYWMIVAEINKEGIFSARI